MEYSHFKEHTVRVVESCSRVIVGKEETVRLIFISFLCSGHVLLEDVPGTGKTMLLKAFARTVGSGFKRIQFTPDLLPSDLTGINFYNQKTGEFQFREGPLFTNIVLADEINRATPRTQSSLLEAMEESQITVDGVTYPMAEPFFVMATQNPGGILWDVSPAGSPAGPVFHETEPGLHDQGAGDGGGVQAVHSRYFKLPGAGGEPGGDPRDEGTIYEGAGPEGCPGLHDGHCGKDPDGEPVCHRSIHQGGHRPL